MDLHPAPADAGQQIHGHAAGELGYLPEPGDDHHPERVARVRHLDEVPCRYVFSIRLSHLIEVWTPFSRVSSAPDTPRQVTPSIEQPCSCPRHRCARAPGASCPAPVIWEKFGKTGADRWVSVVVGMTGA